MRDQQQIAGGTDRKQTRLRVRDASDAIGEERADARPHGRQAGDRWLATAFARRLRQTRHDEAAHVRSAVCRVFAPQRGNQLDELLHDRGIVKGALPRSQDLHRALIAQPGPIGTIRRQRVEAIDDGQDACADRNFRADEAVGISAAVPLLVVMPHDGHDRVREIDRGQDPRIGSTAADVAIHAAYDLLLTWLGI